MKTSEPLINIQTKYTKDEINTIWDEIKEIKAVLKNTNKQHPRTVGKAETQNLETQTNSQPETTENLNKITNYFKKIDKPNYDKLIKKNTKIYILEEKIDKMKKVNDQLTNQVDRLKNESKELRNRLNVIETESKSTRPRPKAKHTVQTVQP